MKNFYTLLAVGFLAASSPTYGEASASPILIAPPSGTETIVSQQPSGNLTLYSRTSRGFRLLLGNVEPIVDEGSIVKMVEQGDRTVWLHNTIPTFLAPGWIKAEKSDGKLTINGPQLIYEEYDWYLDDGSYLKYFLTAVEIYEYEDEEGNLMRGYRPTEDGVFSFTINGTTIKEAGDGALILGVVAYSEQYGYYFTGYGSNYIVLTLPEVEEIKVPETAEIHKNWAMHYYDWDGYEQGQFVDVAIDGNDYYIKGIYPSIPDSWVKGTLEGKVITFPNFQYIGPDLEWNMFVYLAGGQLMESEIYEDVTEAVIDPEGFGLSLEKDGTLDALTNIIFATSPATDPDNANFVDYFEGVYIVPQDPSTFTDPVGPDELWKGNFNGFPTIEFNLPAIDENGNLLNTDNIYISAYVNSDIFTFTPEDYVDLKYFGIDHPATELPYKFPNGWDFYQEGTWHTIYIYGVPDDDVYNIGIQSIYYPEGKDINPENVLKSDIILVGSPDNPNSADDLDVSSEVKDVLFYDMQGRRIEHPSKGVYLKKTIFSNGMVKTSKTISK